MAPSASAAAGGDPVLLLFSFVSSFPTIVFYTSTSSNYYL